MKTAEKGFKQAANLVLSFIICFTLLTALSGCVEDLIHYPNDETSEDGKDSNSDKKDQKMYFINAGQFNGNLIPDYKPSLPIPENVIFAIPEVNLNDDGTINSVDWSYLSPDASGVKPEQVIDEIMLQIDGSGESCKDNPQDNRIYNSEMAPPSKTSETLSCQNIKWSDVTCIYMAYNSVSGDHYVITWRK